MELQYLTRLGKKIGLSVIFFLLIPANLVKAQVVPDGTLKSTVETIQELMKIDGGLKSGSNLFHSFEEFNIPEGMETSFENALEIENIFTRVTGDSASTINGTLSAQGGANLFLMNPNGIVFGQDASINLGGSFIATTADSIQFQDSTEFAATGTEDPTPLLTNEIPIGLGFGSNSGAIEVNGEGNEIAATSSSSPTSVESSGQGLKVESGNTLGIVGNNVIVDGGTLTAKGGNIELGSVSSSVVGIKETENQFTFQYDGVNDYRDINLDNQALVDSSGKVAGAISLAGDNINLKGGSLILLQNQGETASGDIAIDAHESLVLQGTSSGETTFSGIKAEAINTGKGANIFINTPEIILQDAGKILANTYGEASGGNISISTDSAVRLEESPFSSLATIGASAYDRGNAGSVNISTQELQIFNGGQIASAAFSSGNAGDVVIDAKNSIEVVGVRKLPGQNAPVSSTITSGTVDSGNAGTLTLNTSSLSVIDGGLVSTSSFTNGDAGSITINASNSITVSGQSQDGLQQSTITSSVVAVNPELQEIFGLSEPPSGRSGNVTITTSDIQIDNNGFVSVRNEGTGEGGELLIDANNVRLEEQGSITAAAASGTGGNININAINLSAKKDSAISANAEGGDGGNITIDTETLLGLDNSDITANAVEGDGGNINITATSILGFEERPELTPLSDITASSDFGVDGTVTINSPETNAEEDVQVSAKKPEAPLTPLEFVKGSKGDWEKLIRGLNPDANFKYLK